MALILPLFYENDRCVELRMTQVHSKRIDLRHFRRAQAKEDANGFNDALRNPVRRACFSGKTFRSGLTVPATALPQQADVVVRLPQHVVGQERQNYGADFALQNAFGAGESRLQKQCVFFHDPTEKQVQFHGVSQRLLNIEY